MKKLPWFPSGADLNPLDIAVWDSIKNNLQGYPKESYNSVKKLEAVLYENFDKLRSDPEWLAFEAKTCRSVPKRAQWVVDNNGEKIVDSVYNKKKDSPQDPGVIEN